MRKSIIILCLILLFVQSAFALNTNEYPIYNGEPVAGNQLGAEIEGVPVLLDLDPATDYSYVYNDTIQACFYAYNADKTSYLEVYLILPGSVAAGDTIDPAYCAEHSCSACSATVNEVTETTEDYYTVFSVGGAGYPAGCDYSIRIDQVSYENDSVTVSGTLTAVLCKFEGLNMTDQLLNLNNASFNCTVKVRTEAVATPAPSSTDSPDAGTVPDPATHDAMEPTPTPFAVKV